MHFLYEIFTCQIATSKTPTDRQIPIESTVINSNIFFLSLLFPSRYDFFFDSELCHFLHYVIFNVRFLDIKKSSFNSLGFVYLPFGVTLLSKKGETGDPSIIGAAASGVRESAQWERSLLALPLPAVSRMSSSLIL